MFTFIFLFPFVPRYIVVMWLWRGVIHSHEAESEHLLDYLYRVSSDLFILNNIVIGSATFCENYLYYIIIIREVVLDHLC